MSSTILYLEDNNVDLSVMRIALRVIGCEMATAQDALAGITIAKETIPDLILTDINLRGNMDGLEMTRHLKADPTTAQIPIVAVTGHVGIRDQKRCFDAGCDEYIPKPISLTQLQEVIERFVYLDASLKLQGRM